MLTSYTLVISSFNKPIIMMLELGLLYGEEYPRALSLQSTFDFPAYFRTNKTVRPTNKQARDD